VPAVASVVVTEEAASQQERERDVEMEPAAKVVRAKVMARATEMETPTRWASQRANPPA